MYCPNPDCPVAQSTGQPAEYEPGISHCRDCQTALEETPPSRNEDESVLYEEFVRVLEVTNAAIVPVIQSLLQSAEIRFFIKGEGVQDLFGWGRFGAGYSLVTGPPAVYVEPERAEEARELLADVGMGHSDLASEE